uniref:Uncharacterized protein n=1 Tax=Arundo donax TaxID=35708 RepID=A0A0A8ZB35_ARUDO
MDYGQGPRSVFSCMSGVGCEADMIFQLEMLLLGYSFVA